MRILVLAPQPFMVLRGTPIAVRMLLETLSARGDSVDLLTFPDGADVDLAHCRIFRLPSLPGLRGIRPGFSARKLAADALMLPMAAWRMARTRYDLVIGVEEAMFMAMVLKPIFSLPYLADVDSSIPEQIDDKFGLPTWLRRWLDWAEGAAFRRASGAITCCRALEETVRSHAPDLPVQTVEDVTMLDPNTRPSVPDDCRFDEPVVMYVGNLEPYQGVDLLMAGFAQLNLAARPAKLVVIGGSAAHIAEARKRARDLGIAEHTHFLGPRSLERLGDYLSAANIVASPRIQGRNTPMKVYSYLDSGRPLIATRLETHTQVLDDDIAMLVDPEPEAMAGGLEQLLSDIALRDRLATAARIRVVEDFSSAAYRRKLDRFLNERIVTGFWPERRPKTAI